MTENFRMIWNNHLRKVTEDNFKLFWEDIEYKKKLRNAIDLNISLLMFGGLILLLINALDVVERGQELAFVFVFICFVLVALFSGFVKKFKVVIHNLATYFKFIKNNKYYKNNNN